MEPFPHALDKHKPETPEFYFELGNTYTKAGKPAEAIPWFEEALRRRPDPDLRREAQKGLR
jgi:hypothetical protein